MKGTDQVVKLSSCTILGNFLQQFLQEKRKKNSTSIFFNFMNFFFFFFRIMSHYHEIGFDAGRIANDSRLEEWTFCLHALVLGYSLQMI